MALLLGSGGEHCDLELAVAGNTLVLSLLFGSGGEHCDLALAVEVRQRRRRRRRRRDS